MGASLVAMKMLRPYIPPLTLVLAVQAGIYHGLLALGAEADLVLCMEMIWLCVGVWVTLELGERLERKWEDRGD
jgi:hypothetical protein